MQQDSKEARPDAVTDRRVTVLLMAAAAIVALVFVASMLYAS